MPVPSLDTRLRLHHYQRLPFPAIVALAPTVVALAAAGGLRMVFSAFGDAGGEKGRTALPCHWSSVEIPRRVIAPHAFLFSR